MAKKKLTKNKGGMVKQFSPEQYIRTRVRTLPIDRCYINQDSWIDGTAAIAVVRRHPQGTFTIGMYLVDLFCRGVYDSYYHFSIDDDEVDEILETYFNHSNTSFKQTSYVEVHNIIYGAISFAEEAGIMPCKEWNLTRYILEEDTDEIELIEYEFGENGRHFLMVGTRLEASRYIPALNEHLGIGNYDVYIHDDDDYDDDFDDEDYDDDDNDIFNNENGARLLRGISETETDLSKLLARLYDPDRLSTFQAISFYTTLRAFAERVKEGLECEKQIFDSYIQLFDEQFTSDEAFVANLKLEQDRLLNAINDFSKYSVEHIDDQDIINTRLNLDIYMCAYRAIYEELKDKTDDELKEININRNHKGEEWLINVMDKTEKGMEEMNKIGEILDRLKGQG